MTPVSPRARVTFITDVPMRFATTGARLSVSADGLTQVFEATNVRDMTTAAASDYRTTSATVGDNTVRVYYRPGAPASAMLNAAKSALTKLEARLGPYPYKVLKIVQTAGGYGMEGPAVVWIPTGVASANLPYLVTHEVAHQWFYGIVGNDQAREPFADEAATDFVARYVLGMRRASRCTRDRPRQDDLPLLERVLLRAAVHPAAATSSTTRASGWARRAFWAALRDYLDANRWGLSHTRTLLRTLDDATPLDLGAWWGSRFPKIVLSEDDDERGRRDGARAAGDRRGRRGVRGDLRPVRRADGDLVRARATHRRRRWRVASRARSSAPRGSWPRWTGSSGHTRTGPATGSGRPTTGRSRRRSTSTRHSASAASGAPRCAPSSRSCASRASTSPSPESRGPTRARSRSTGRSASSAIGEFEAIGWKFDAWHGVEWFALELSPRDPIPDPVTPLPELLGTPELAGRARGPRRRLSQPRTQPSGSASSGWRGRMSTR